MWLQYCLFLKKQISSSKHCSHDDITQFDHYFKMNIKITFVRYRSIRCIVYQGLCARVFV